MVTDNVDMDNSADEQLLEQDHRMADAVATGQETETGLSENVAGALSYLLGIITGIVFLVVEKDNEYVRFNAAQSIVVFGGIAVLSIGISVLSTIIGFVLGDFLGLIVGFVLLLVWGAVGLVGFGLWAFLMYRAYRGNSFRVPIAAGYADRIAK
jgi:uncharacterized membrane protein